MLNRFFCATRPRGVSILAALALTFGVCGVHAGSVDFAKRTLYVPDPEGFEPLAKAIPRFIQVAQAYLPATNRLIDAYATADDEAALELGKPIELKRYFQLQTLRSLDGVPVSNEEFKAAANDIEKGLKEALGSADSLGSDLTDKGNRAVKDLTSVDPQISLSGTGYLGVYRREPWGQFFTIKSSVSTGRTGETSKLVCAGAVALVNYQVVFMYAYSHYKNESDRLWVQDAVSAWADAVHGANPDDPKAAPSSSFHFNYKSIMRSAMIGGVIGALIGLVAFLIRKSRGNS